MSGVRAQLVVTPIEAMPTSPPTAAPTSTTPARLLIHATPLRCSRALALRHLAARYKAALGPNWTVVTFAATPPPPHAHMAGIRSGGSTGAGTSIDSSMSSAASLPAMPPMCMHASDGEDLVAGVQRVVVLPRATPAAPAGPSPGCGGALATFGTLDFPVDLAPFHPTVVDLAEVREGVTWPEGSRMVVVVAP